MLSSETLLNVIPIVALIFLPIAIESSEVRSKIITQRSNLHTQDIDPLIRQLNTSKELGSALSQAYTLSVKTTYQKLIPPRGSFFDFSVEPSRHRCITVLSPLEELSGPQVSLPIETYSAISIDEFRKIIASLNNPEKSNDPCHIDNVRNKVRGLRTLIVDEIKPFLKHPNPQVRMATLLFLSKSISDYIDGNSQSSGSVPSLPEVTLPMGDRSILNTREKQRREIFNVITPLVSEIKLLVNDPNRDVRIEVAILLGKYDVLGNGTLPALRLLYQDSEADVRASVAWAIQRITSEEFRRAEIEYVAFKKMHIADLEFAESDFAKRFALLLPMLKDLDPRVRTQAAITFRKMKPYIETMSRGTKEDILNFSDPWVEVLQTLLKDPDLSVRINATCAIGAAGELAGSALSEILQQLKDPDDLVRECSVQTIGQMGPVAKSAAPELILLIQDPQGRLRGHALYALEQIGESSRLNQATLFQLLKDDDRLTRGNTADLLGNRGEVSNEVIMALVPLLGEPYDITSESASIALSNMGAPVIPVLTPYLTSIPSLTSTPSLKSLYDFRLRQSIIRVFGKMGKAAQSTIPLLRKLSQDQDERVRSQALEALRSIQIDMSKREIQKPLPSATPVPSPSPTAISNPEPPPVAR